MIDDVTNFLRASVADQLGISPEEVDPNTDFEEMGMTSLSAVLVSGVIEDEYDIEIEPSILFENRTLATVSAALKGLLEDAKK